jgi:uncharacterized membrane protein YqgA involved in biofilm formation
VFISAALVFGTLIGLFYSRKLDENLQTTYKAGMVCADDELITES